MKLISHRGNILGRKKQLENNPNYIENTLKLGYDVEIDVWSVDKFNPEDIKNLYRHVNENNSDIGTLAAKIYENKIFNNENIVKVKTQDKLKGNNFVLAISITILANYCLKVFRTIL